MLCARVFCGQGEIDAIASATSFEQQQKKRIKEKIHPTEKSKFTLTWFECVHMQMIGPRPKKKKRYRLL